MRNRTRIAVSEPVCSDVRAPSRTDQHRLAVIADSVARQVHGTLEYLAELASAWPNLPQSTRDAIAALTVSKDTELGDVVFAIANAWPRMPEAQRQALRAVVELG